MKWTVFGFAAVLSVAAAAAGFAAQSAPSDPAGPGREAITFEQYREWRLSAIERRRSEIAMQLLAADLAAPRKTRLEETRAYYEWLAALPEPDRDRRFRERFDRIDANRDGVIDAAERAAWREKQRAFYGRSRTARDPAGDTASP